MEEIPLTCTVAGKDLDGLIESVKHNHSSIREFDASCFSGEYVTGDVSSDYLAAIEAQRGESQPRPIGSGKGAYLV